MEEIRWARRALAACQTEGQALEGGRISKNGERKRTSFVNSEDHKPVVMTFSLGTQLA